LKRSENPALEGGGCRRRVRFPVGQPAEAPDFPFPVSTMSGGWQGEDAGAGSTVKVWWSLTRRRADGRGRSPLPGPCVAGRRLSRRPRPDAGPPPAVDCPIYWHSPRSRMD